MRLATYNELLKWYVPILTTSHVPNLTFYVPNLTGSKNVPKIEQCHKNGPILGLNSLSNSIYYIYNQNKKGKEEK
jgi:hypothetical protein